MYLVSWIIFIRLLYSPPSTLSQTAISQNMTTLSLTTFPFNSNDMFECAKSKHFDSWSQISQWTLQTIVFSMCPIPIVSPKSCVVANEPRRQSAWSCSLQKQGNLRTMERCPGLAMSVRLIERCFRTFIDFWQRLWLFPYEVKITFRIKLIFINIWNSHLGHYTFWYTVVSSGRRRLLTELLMNSDFEVDSKYIDIKISKISFYRSQATIYVNTGA